MGGQNRATYQAQIINRVRRLGPDRWDAAVERARARAKSKTPHGADLALIEAIGG